VTIIEREFLIFSIISIPTLIQTTSEAWPFERTLLAGTVASFIFICFVTPVHTPHRLSACSHKFFGCSRVDKVNRFQQLVHTRCPGEENDNQAPEANSVGHSLARRCPILCRLVLCVTYHICFHSLRPCSSQFFVPRHLLEHDPCGPTRFLL